MPEWPRVFSIATTIDAAVTLAAETVIATLPGVSTPTPDAIVRLRGWAQITTGASTTAVTLRIRRVSLTGALVGEGNPISIASAAGGTDEYEILTQDSPGDVASFAYVLTAQQTAGGANGSALQSYLEALVQ